MSRFEKVAVSLTTWLMAISGVVFFYMKYLMTSSDPFSAVHHPWQPQVLAFHVIIGPFAVFALGLIARDHILDRILEPRRRAGRASGWALLALAGPMIASGYLMQVWTDPGIKRILVGVHVVAGTLYTVSYAGHLLASRWAGAGANGSPRPSVRRRSRRIPRTARSLDHPIRGV